MGDNWWVAIWMSVGSMLDPTDYDAWCDCLASDQRTWLTAGKMLGAAWVGPGSADLLGQSSSSPV